MPSGRDARGVEEGPSLHQLDHRAAGGASRAAALGVETGLGHAVALDPHGDAEEVAAGRAAGGAGVRRSRERAEPPRGVEVVLEEQGAARVVALATGGDSGPRRRCSKMGGIGYFGLRWATLGGWRHTRVRDGTSDRRGCRDGGGSHGPVRGAARGQARGRTVQAAPSAHDRRRDPCRRDRWAVRVGPREPGRGARGVRGAGRRLPPVLGWPRDTVVGDARGRPLGGAGRHARGAVPVRRRTRLRLRNRRGHGHGRVRRCGARGDERRASRRQC